MWTTMSKKSAKFLFSLQSLQKLLMFRLVFLQNVTKHFDKTWPCKVFAIGSQHN
jgi:hypothetical protein